MNKKKLKEVFGVIMHMLTFFFCCAVGWFLFGAFISCFR